ncbi:MAG: T9SS type A sorting domain-containing protein [Bacteroidota bacterium]
MNRLFVFLTLFSLTVCLQGQIQVGQDIDGELTGDYFGRSVSISSDGSLIAIGGSQNDGNGTSSGHTRVYEEITGVWTQLGADIDGEAAGDASGLAVSLAGDGTSVAIGAFGNDQNGAQSGHVRVFTYSGAAWVQKGADIDGDVADDYFGWNVCLSEDGSRMIIGAPYNDGGGADAGHAKVYEYNGTNWVQVGADIQGEAVGDRAGWAVSISDDGTRIAVGATANDDNGNSSGHVRIFDEVGGNWVQVGTDLDGEAADDQFGLGVALSGDGNRIAVGGHFNNGNGGRSGHVRVFEENAGNWTQIGVDIDGENGGDQSGRAVAISEDGSRIAIGAYLNDGNGNSSGQIRVYDDLSGTWTQVGLDIDGEGALCYFGHEDAVAMSADGSRVAGGGPLNNSVGSARVFEMSAILAQLSLFQGRQVESSIELFWKNENEIAYQGFEIERSLNASSWESLGQVSGQVNQQDYLFRDISPVLGRNFYRLRMTDIDGAISFSSIIEVAFDIQSAFDIYPNPSNGTFQLSIPFRPEAPITLSVTNLAGQKVMDISISPAEVSNPISLNFPAKGYYIISVDSGREILSKRILIE